MPFAKLFAIFAVKFHHVEPKFHVFHGYKWQFGDAEEGNWLCVNFSRKSRFLVSFVRYWVAGKACSKTP